MEESSYLYIILYYRSVVRGTTYSLTLKEEGICTSVMKFLIKRELRNFVKPETRKKVLKADLFWVKLILVIYDTK